MDIKVPDERMSSSHLITRYYWHAARWCRSK